MSTDKMPPNTNRPGAMQSYVFHDPSGRRARNVRLLGGLAIALCLAMFAAFAATLAFAPHVPEVRFRDPHTLTALNVKVPRRATPWTATPKRPRVHGSATRPLTIAFYVSWDEQSAQALREHLQDLDVLSPQWVMVSTPDGQISATADPRAEELIRNAKKRPAIMPVVHNAVDGVWVTKPIEQLLRSPKGRAALIKNLQTLADQRGFSGYIFDFENLTPAALAAYPQFIAEVNLAFQASNREIWVTVPVDDTEWPLRALQKAADAIVPMMYDEHWQTGSPGPSASQAWFQAKLSEYLRGLDPNKIVLALGSYGYDWAKGETQAQAITFHEAMQSAHDAGVPVVFDHTALNPMFRYADDKQVSHEVWFLDAATLYNQIKIADAWRPRGYAIWRLGAEDPGIWSLLGRRYDTASIAALPDMPASHDIDFNGLAKC